MQHSFRIQCIFAFLLQMMFLIPGKTQVQDTAALMKAFHSVSSIEIQSYIQEMVHPRYRGRLAGSPEYMQIAQWSADLMKEWGIEPYGDNGTYFQNFYRPWCNVLDAGHVILRNGKETKQLIVKEEYYPGANPDSGMIKAPLVFAGHGITFDEMGYDDYAGINVKGKIVLISGDVPYKGKNEDTTAMWTFYNSHRYKYSNAFEHGAAGVLLIDMMASPGTPFFENFYYASVDQSVARYVLQNKHQNYDTIVKYISVNMKPNSFETGIEAEILTHVQCFEEGTTANVIGFIEGNDPVLKNEIIIIGAHLDGQGYLGFLLPGALDNASGVADVLAASKVLAKMKGQMKRSIVIILFGGEECGLLGSLYFTEHPEFPADKVLLMINLDMVGNGTGLAAWGAKSYPQVLAHFEKANYDYIHRPFRATENRKVKGRPRTDGLVFLMKGIPTIHLGITDREFPLYYHSYKDTDDLLSFETMEDAAKLLFLSVFRIASDETISLPE